MDPKHEREDPKPEKPMEWRPADDADHRGTRHGGDTRIEHDDRDGTKRREPEEPHRESEAV